MAILGALKVIFEHGGIAAWFIFLAAGVLIVVGLERIYFLFIKMNLDTDEHIEYVQSLVLKKNYDKALQVCNVSPENPDLKVIKSGLLALENGREAVKSSLGASVVEIAHLLEKRLPLISLVASVGTLLGLLGTITGLITTFTALATADAGEKGKMLGVGISEAMYSTATGLIVGVTAMVIHTICSSKSDAILSRAQTIGFKLMSWIEQSERK